MSEENHRIAADMPNKPNSVTLHYCSFADWLTQSLGEQLQSCDAVCSQTVTLAVACASKGK